MSIIGRFKKNSVLLLAGVNWFSPLSASAQESPAAVAQTSRRSPAPIDPLTHVVVGEEVTGFVTRAIGVRGALSSSSDDKVTGGASLHERGFALLYGPVITGRYLDDLWIGGDGGGVTYSLSGQMALGARWEMTGNQGPFARVELRGEMRRVGGWYYSSLRLPGAQVGWGIDNGPWMVELLGHLSPSLTGRLRSANFWREAEGLFTGGAGTLAWKNWQLNGDLSYLRASEASAELWDIRAHLCSYWGKGAVPITQEEKSLRPRRRKYSFGVCADVNALSFPAFGSLEAQGQFSGGLSIIFGEFMKLDRARKM